MASIGVPVLYAKGDLLAKAGVQPDTVKVMYVASGEVNVVAGSQVVATVRQGAVLGEMTMLLHDTPNVSLVAKSNEVETLEVTHEDLVQKLLQEPKLSGRVFKMLAVVISERIAATSARARDEVLRQGGARHQRSTKLERPAEVYMEVAEHRKAFGLDDPDEGLRLKATISCTRETNAKRDDDVQFGEVFLFDRHIGFSWKVFGFSRTEKLSLVDVLGVLHDEASDSECDVVKVELKGSSYEVKFPDPVAAKDAWTKMEACRRAAASMARITATGVPAAAQAIDPDVATAFRSITEETQTRKRNVGLSMELTLDDWSQFLSGAKQRKFSHGEYVLREGVETHALYQILQGSLRVELQLADQPTAIVVGHRGAGEMFVRGADNISIEEIFANRAFMSIFLKYLTKSAEDRTADADERAAFQASITARAFWQDVQEEFKLEPDIERLRAAALRLHNDYASQSGAKLLACFTPELRVSMAERVQALQTQDLSQRETIREARKLFNHAQTAVVEAIANQCYSMFVASEHFEYIHELRAKEGMVPGYTDFQPIRVLGEGGFGQVIEVVKRDCGKHYAMKVMQKEKFRQCFGSVWRQKIWLEKDLMASLHHPFLVNLHYAFQNHDFLVLVMDLVPAGDLSEFVLTEKRLTPAQVRIVMMEVVCVIHHCHRQNVLYRDLKPENLLIDAAGHVRLIDMGLAARISKKRPKRWSRVGTECYMAPEVRWAEKRSEPYGLSCDWYTVGVLLYEFSAGDLPYEEPEADHPMYAHHNFADPLAEDLVKKLIDQDHTKRFGCGENGIDEIHHHPYWRGVEWELVPLKKFDSPCKNLKKPAKGKKRKKEEEAALQVANELVDAEHKPMDDTKPVEKWDFVSPKAITEEYMENMFRLVSSI